MNDQLIIGEKASFDDYMASLASRKIGLPKKKSVKETIPYSNRTYDFSKINGELYWEERELEYVFEMLASTPEELEELKTDFSSWVMNVFEEEIHDPFIPDYHFIGTYEDIDFEDEETLDKTTATVKFNAYPYKIANLPTVFELESDGSTVVSAEKPDDVLGAYSEEEIHICNNSSHRVKATFKFSYAPLKPTYDFAMFVINDDTSNPLLIDSNTVREAWLPCGVSVIVILGHPQYPYTCEIAFTEEVF